MGPGTLAVVVMSVVVMVGMQAVPKAAVARRHSGWCSSGRRRHSRAVAALPPAAVLDDLPPGTGARTAVGTRRQAGEAVVAACQRSGKVVVVGVVPLLVPLLPLVVRCCTTYDLRRGKTRC